MVKIFLVNYLVLVTSDAVVSFLQEFCLRKKFLQEVRNLARILHLNVSKRSLITLKPMRKTSMGTFHKY